jgi:hypothetical protein
MVAEPVPRNKLAARWTGPHEVVRCLSEHLEEIKDIVTGKTTTVHASHLDYYDDAAVGAGADERVRRQAAHEAFLKSPGSEDTGGQRTAWAGSCGRYGAGSRTPRSRSSGARSATRSRACRLWCCATSGGC